MNCLKKLSKNIRKLFYNILELVSTTACPVQIIKKKQKSSRLRTWIANLIDLFLKLFVRAFQSLKYIIYQLTFFENLGVERVEGVELEGVEGAIVVEGEEEHELSDSYIRWILLLWIVWFLVS